MKSAILSTLMLLMTIIGLFAQSTPISGIINSYAAITSISSPPDDCYSVITVNDATAFQVGDKAIIIQMQGATIDESNSASFGDITDIGGAGWWEEVSISAVMGNEITIQYRLIHDYDVNGKVQIISMPSWEDATVTAPIQAQAWDGNTGGVIALEVTGTLDLQASIDATASGFRGGVTSNPSSNCVGPFPPISGYYYPEGAWESEQKGEGVAAYIANKEYGRGAQANGGGAGNDHNAGGGGGAAYGAGGIGGENQEPGLFNCNSYNPGRGGKPLDFSPHRLFLGGGGGAGHDNNNVTPQGGTGGGIIIIQAGTIQANGWSILANGEDLGITGGMDGGSGGGGGGAIYLAAAQVNNATIEAKGGKGCDTENSGNPRCMGPGGGGGGGVVYAPASVNADVTGGAAGTIVNSSAGCNGSTANAQAGGDGVVLPLFDIPTNPGASFVSLEYDVCEGDGFSIDINGTIYNENNTTGQEVMQGQYGCDSIIAVTVDVSELGMNEVDMLLCEEEAMIINGTTYDIDNPTGQEVLPNAAYNGCDSVIMVHLEFAQPNVNEMTETLCQGESITINGVTYDANNPSGTDTISAGAYNGCDSIILVDLAYSPSMAIAENINGDTVTIIVNGGTPPFSYDWTMGLTGDSNILSNSGEYEVTVTDGIGCSAVHSFSFTSTGLAALWRQKGLQIFPNPTQDHLYLQLQDTPKEPIIITVYDALGRTKYSTLWAGKEESIDVQHWARGIYYIRLNIRQGTYSQRIVVE